MNKFLFNAIYAKIYSDFITSEDRMKIYFATQNLAKLEEAKITLGQYDIDVEGIKIDFWEPDSGSFFDVIKFKLEQVKNMGYERIVVDDAGIFLNAYPNFPGVLTKRIFAQIGYKGLQKLLIGEERTAYFQGVIAIMWEGEVKLFSAETRGRLIDIFPTDNPNDKPYFPFDPIFIPDGETRTLGEMSINERLKYSYRRQNFSNLGKWLKSIIPQG